MRQNLLAGVEELIDRNVSYGYEILISTVIFKTGNNFRNRQKRMAHQQSLELAHGLYSERCGDRVHEKGKKVPLE